MKRSYWVFMGSVAVFVLMPLLFSPLFSRYTQIVLSATIAPSPTTTPSANRAPYAVAKMSVDNGKTYSSKVTVTQGVGVNVRLSAGEKGSAGSFDPDGWDTVGKGVSKGGKIEWNSDLNLGVPTFEKTFSSPASPSSADMNLGNKVFTVAPGKYTYNLLKITDAAGVESNTGAVEFTVLPNPNNNRPPHAVAKMSVDGGAYSSNVTVTRGVPVNIAVSAGEKGSAGSYDPDGWDTVGKGVSKGGKIEWNNNLWLGQPRFEKTFSNPISPSHADMNLGRKTFTLAPGKYIYKMLKITDAGGLVSNIGAIEFTVLAPPTPTPEPCNGYDGGNGYDSDCDDPNGYDGNGYDGGNGYDSGFSSSGSFTAMITSPTSGTKISQGQNVAVAVTGKGKPECGYWTLQIPGGRVATLTSADFVSGTIPGNLPSCK